MQVCKKCGKPVVYIARISNEVITCEENQIVIYTKFGREVKGYQRHKCEIQNAEDIR